MPLQLVIKKLHSLVFWLCLSKSKMVSIWLLESNFLEYHINKMEGNLTWVILSHLLLLPKKRKGKKNHNHCVLIIRNALLLTLKQIVFYSSNKMSDTQFWVFSSTGNKRIVEYLRVKLRWLRQAQSNLKLFHWRQTKSEFLRMSNTWKQAN